MKNNYEIRDLEADRIWIVEDSHKTTPLDRIALHAIYRALTAESRIDQLIRGNEEVKRLNHLAYEDLRKEKNNLLSSLNLAVKALEWYADESNHETLDGYGGRIKSNVDEDDGELAQSTLDQIGG